MFLSGRQAADVLAGAGLCRRQARRGLAAGLAGDPVVTRGAHLFSEARVRELLDRPHVTPEELDSVGTSLLFLARRQVDVRAPLPDQLTVLAVGWDIGLTLSVLIRARARQEGWVPLVATVGGFVASGADILDLRACSPSGSRRNLVLREPGSWFDAFRGKRLPFGPGRDFLLHGWTPGRPIHVQRSRPAVPGAGVGGSTHPTPEENA